MPHIILEHSLQKDFKVIALFSSLADVFKDLAQIGNFDISQCKFRSLKSDYFAIADNQDHDANFCHLEIRILTGRSIEVKKILAQKLFDTLNQHLKNLFGNNLKLDLSVNIVEITKEVYQKGTL